MPKKYDSCIREVNKLIKNGKIKRYYYKNGNKLKTNPYAICKSIPKLMKDINKALKRN